MTVAVAHNLTHNTKSHNFLEQKAIMQQSEAVPPMEVFQFSPGQGPDEEAPKPPMMADDDEDEEVAVAAPPPSPPTIGKDDDDKRNCCNPRCTAIGICAFLLIAILGFLLFFHGLPFIRTAYYVQLSVLTSFFKTGLCISRYRDWQQSGGIYLPTRTHSRHRRNVNWTCTKISFV